MFPVDDRQALAARHLDLDDRHRSSSCRCQRPTGKLLVLNLDLELTGALDHVVVGEELTPFIYDRTRAGPFRRNRAPKLSDIRDWDIDDAGADGPIDLDVVLFVRCDRRIGGWRLVQPTPLAFERALGASDDRAQSRLRTRYRNSCLAETLYIVNSSYDCFALRQC